MATAARKREYSPSYEPPVYRGSRESYASAAAQPLREPLAQPRPRPQTQPAPSRNPRPASKPKVHPLKKLMALGMIVTIFASAYLIVLRSVRIADNQTQINQLRDEVKLLQDENRNLTAQFNMAQSMDTMKTRAQTELGMDYAKADQIFYIDLNEPLEDEPPPAEQVSLFKWNLWDFILGLLD